MNFTLGFTSVREIKCIFFTFTYVLNIEHKKVEQKCLGHEKVSFQAIIAQNIPRQQNSIKLYRDDILLQYVVCFTSKKKKILHVTCDT